MTSIKDEISQLAERTGQIADSLASACTQMEKLDEIRQSMYHITAGFVYDNEQKK